MKSEIIQKARSKLSKLLKDKEVIDIILFGSAIKGKANPNDIDVCIITNKEQSMDINGFHISQLTPEELISGGLTLPNTLLREGFSLKHNTAFADLFRFKNKILYTYSLTSLNPSKKVQMVNILRGRNKNNGLVLESKGEWLSNQVFTIPLDSEYLFDKLLSNFNIKYTKNYILIH